VFAAQLPEVREVLLAKATELRCPVIETPEAFRVESESIEDGCARASVLEVATDELFSIAPQLRGRFQLQNALNALAVARYLQSRNYKISNANIERGIASAVWPGRIERVRTKPDVYLDGAHNPGASRELAKYIQENLQGRRIYMIFAAMRDKAVDEVTGILFPLAHHVVFTEAANPRAIRAAQLAEMAGHHAASYEVIPSAEDALESVLAKAHAGDAIFVTGSLYLVGEMRRSLRQRGKAAPAY